jgi:hypothetical protein
MANSRVEESGRSKDLIVQLQGLIGLNLLSYVVNITIFLIWDSILAKGDLCFNLEDEQGLSKGVCSRLLADY